MTTAQLFSRVRTSLDEASASFWTDAEIYSALADGQYEIISIALSIYKQRQELPKVLRTLVKSSTDSILTGNEDTLPTDFLLDLDVEYGLTAGTRLPAYNRELTKGSHFRDNTYLGTTQFYRIEDDTIIFEDSAVTDHYWKITYVFKPTAIASGVEPTLPDFSHPAIAEYAISKMLSKDQRPQEAQLHYQNFSQMIQSYIGV